VIAALAAVRLADIDDDELWTLSEVRLAQRQDLSILRLIRWLEEGRSKPKRDELAVENAETRKIVNQWDLLQCSVLLSPGTSTLIGACTTTTNLQ